MNDSNQTLDCPVFSDDDWKLINGRAARPIQYDGWWSRGLPYEHTAVNRTAERAVAAGGCADVFLFDLARDPSEHVNVALDHPGVVARLQARIAELADPKRGYRRPQLNIPHPRSLPRFHNGTWSPFLEAGAS